MKPRENRQTVKVTARMKTGDGWQDVAIHNVSAHGMKVSVALPPRRGAVIEIRRASQIIVARAMWVQDNECGLRTQDVVDVPALLDPNAARVEAVCADARADRRTAPRAEDVAARGQRFATRFQAAVMAVAVIAGAGYAAWVVGDVLRAPFVSISSALGGSPAATKDAATAPAK